VADFARRLGVTDIPEHPGPSIALGAYEVSPLELAAGYQVFQTGGGRTTPYLVSQIRSARGDVIYARTESAPTPVLDQLYATRMVGMLKTVITSGTGTGANIGRPAAGKTGTSQDWRDAWFVGFTPDILTAVWVGNDGGAPMAKVTGGELPTEIWKRFMTVAEKNLPPRDFPWLVGEPAGTPAPPVTTVADELVPDDPEAGTSVGRPTETIDAPPPRPPDAAYAQDEGYYGRPPYEEVPRPPPRWQAPASEGRWREPPPGAIQEEDADEPPPSSSRPQSRGEAPPPYDSPADDDPRYRY
jgi:penicillin-binding protein 1A